MAAPDGTPSPTAPDRASAAPGLSEADLREAYRTMVRCRRIDLKAWDLVRQNKVFFAANHAGHEGASTGWALSAVPGSDYLAPHYRDMAALLVLGMPPVRLFGTLFANSAGISRGRQPYCYWGAADLGVLTASGPQPNHLLHGVGVAAAAKRMGTDEVAWVTFGDGGTSRGEFHEGLNFAAIHDLPVIFFCHNNGYTQSVPLHKQAAQPELHKHAVGYDIPGVRVDGMDVLAVYRAAREARERAVSGAGPTLIEAMTYRFYPNTSNDDDTKYRTREEVEKARERDPIELFATWLGDAGLLDAEERASIDEAAREEIDAAAAEAQQAPPPDPEEAFVHTYAQEAIAR